MSKFNRSEWRVDRLVPLKHYRVTHLPCGNVCDLRAEDFGDWGIPLFDDGERAEVPDNCVCERCAPIRLGAPSP